MIKLVKEQIKKAFNLIMIWVAIAVVFGFLYYFLPGELINGRTGESINNILEAIYFSFVTILTIGYGDITAQGFIRILTAIEGLIGWVLFGLIVYKVVSVKEDIILKEIHNLSNEQYLSRVRNSLFISNTNLMRFIKSVQSRKISKDAVIYELEIISTTLRLNIEDATRFLCRSKNSVASEIDEENLLLLINNINMCILNFIDALQVLPKNHKNSVIYNNIKKIIESGESVYNSCNISLKGKKFDELKIAYTKLKEFVKEK
jgi:hypothetical protein